MGFQKDFKKLTNLYLYRPKGKKKIEDSKLERQKESLTPVVQKVKMVIKKWYGEK